MPTNSEPIGADSEGLKGPVLYERIGAAALVTIDRPHRRNAVDGGTADALQTAYEQFIADDDAFCMVLTGSGDQSFCAGADLKAIPSFAHRFDAAGGPMGFSRFTSPKPTIAAVGGYAVAGGFELALWCDMRICAEDATFGFFERRWGVPLIDGGTQRLPRLIGAARALDLILTGRELKLDEADRFGLVTERVPAGQHVQAALTMAEKLAAFPRETLLADRAALLAGMDLPLDEALELEAQTITITAEVAAEGADRFAGGAGRGGSFD